MLEDRLIGGKEEARKKNHLQFHLIQGIHDGDGEMGKRAEGKKNNSRRRSIRKFLITFCCKFIIGCAAIFFSL